MYVGTIIEYDDQSAIQSLPITEVSQQPLYLSLFTSDKGPEDWTVLSGKDWFKAYGDSISFAKHGQPLLQAAVSINAGARLLSKRLVADDATLANISIVATVTEKTEQAKDTDGNLIYLDPNGEDTLDVTETPKNIKKASIKYDYVHTENIDQNDPKEVYEAVKKTITEDGKFLLYTITDNGRGSSDKRIKIIPNYRISRSKTYLDYTLVVTENDVTQESLSFSAVPNMVVNSTNHSLKSVVDTSSSQIRCIQNDEGITSFIAKLAEITGMTEDEVASIDFLFGCSRKGTQLETIELDEAGQKLNNSFGQPLLDGTNGSLGDAPFDGKHDEVYGKLAEAALDGTYDTCIFNLDQYKIELCIDANYPAKVKEAIETLVTFREDFVFLRDMGIHNNTLDMITDYNDSLSVKNKFIATYCTYYDIIDPYSKKQVTVTIGYTLARLMVSHMNAGRILPVCGIKYGMIVDDAVPGTVNFTPVVCPDNNQKEVMEDNRINYAAYIGEDLVLETEYTSQDEYTQFSFLNNILGTQEVVRAIRTRCPAIRYSFIDGEDLERYKADIEDVIANYRSNFKSIEFSYVNDPTYVNNKIFYAALNVCHRDFIQTEWFKVTAITVSES